MLLFPDEEYDSTYSIPFESYYERGFRGILFDTDNTLVLHDEPVTDACKALFQRLHNIGFRTCIVSNNSEIRIKPLADAVGCFYTCKAQKPLIHGLLKGMQIMKTTPENTLYIGDQIYTDVLAGKRAGIHTILVKPLGPEKYLTIRMKRILEKPILNLFHFVH